MSASGLAGGVCWRSSAMLAVAMWWLSFVVVVIGGSALEAAHRVARAVLVRAQERLAVAVEGARLDQPRRVLQQARRFLGTDQRSACVLHLAGAHALAGRGLAGVHAHDL